MKLDYILFKQISILSIFFGVASAFVTLIPIIGTYSFIFLTCFLAPVVIWLLLKYNCLTLSETKDSVIVGAIAGFVGYLAFSVFYIPISIILMKFFHIAANYGIGILLSNGSFFILTVLSIFMGVLGATMNAFTGFLTYYIIGLINSVKK